MWMQEDSKVGIIWKDALNYAENFSDTEKSDWGLPNAKELQSTIDYIRFPETTSSPTIIPFIQLGGFMKVI